MSEESLKNQITELVRTLHKQRSDSETFIPGKTLVSFGGRVYRYVLYHI
jgi:hypothetical protein